MTVEDPDDVDPFDDAPPVSVDGEEPEESPVAGPADPLFAGIDVAALAAERVESAVNKAIGKKIDKMAAEAVAKALTPDVLAHLTAEADKAAQIAVHGRQDAEPGTSEDSPTDTTTEDPPPLYYGSVSEFVRDYLRHAYKRKINGIHTFWSPRWWTSDEAIARLEALWLAWEHLRLDNTTGPSVWWRDHADPHMSVLMSSTGPFSKETAIKATALEPLPHEEPPEALFPDVRRVEQRGD